MLIPDHEIDILGSDMSPIQKLSAKLDSILQLDQHVAIGRGSGRVNNPLYDPEATGGMRKLGNEGREVRVPLSKVVSTQRTVHYSTVRKMATKVAKGTIGERKPTAIAQNGRYVLTDGNHLAASHLRAKKRFIRLLVQ
jgi:hypothetical protein